MTCYSAVSVFFKLITSPLSATDVRTLTGQVRLFSSSLQTVWSHRSLLLPSLWRSKEIHKLGVFKVCFFPRLTPTEEKQIIIKCPEKVQVFSKTVNLFCTEPQDLLSCDVRMMLVGKRRPARYSEIWGHSSAFSVKWFAGAAGDPHRLTTLIHLLVFLHI